MKRQITYSESLKLGEENICSKADIIDNSSSKPNSPPNQDSKIIPVYRVYNPNSGEHFYTKSDYEAESLKRVGWRREGIEFYSDSSNKRPTFRLYNKNGGAGSHFVTMNSYERDHLISVGWKYEGIAWFGN